MDDNEHTIYVQMWYPRGVKHAHASGGHHYIGWVDESTVLKYPFFKEQSWQVEVEGKLYEHVGEHRHVVKYKGKHEDGVLLELEPNGSLDNYLREHPELSIAERLRIAKETALGVGHIHGKSVLLCDINVRNILLSSTLEVKLCDLTGRLLGPNGDVLLNGGSSENAESYKPREDDEYADK
jgi:hypothetical protein